MPTLQVGYALNIIYQSYTFAEDNYTVFLCVQQRSFFKGLLIWLC